MNNPYYLRAPEQLLSPSLLVFRELVRQNLRTMITLAGGAERLRPHCKTHKMPDLVRLQCALGIRKHKAATIAEVEMLARAGVTDIVLAFPIVGPNVDRVVHLRKAFPEVTLAVTVDDPAPLAALGASAHQAGITIEVLVDLNVGMNRTGIALGPAAIALYQQLGKTPGLIPGGLQIYDGHNSGADPDQRKASVAETWARVTTLIEELERSGLPIPRLVCGGTGSLPAFAQLSDPRIELSAGTTVLHDTGYGDRYPDLAAIVPAALILTRVISRPAPEHLTLDAGHKSASPDQPLGQRLRLLDLPDVPTVVHSEEHWTIKTDAAAKYPPGTPLLAIPRHVCTTTHLHEFAYVIENGELVDTWTITARNRQLTF